MLEIRPRARCPHRTGKKRKYWAANLQTMCRKRRSHRPAWRAVICAHVGMRASRLTWPGVQCALPRAPQGQTLFSNALNPYKHYLIHQQGGREVFPVALFCVFYYFNYSAVLYPSGLWLCQFQLSRHISSMPYSASQPSSRLALLGSHQHSAISPGRRGSMT